MHKLFWIAIVPCHHCFGCKKAINGMIFAETSWSNLNGSDWGEIIALLMFRFTSNMIIT